ncbi:MAG: alpha-amylase [Gemmatimonadaceae bacterium]|nr:alpha-amylase [Gemmatimonadaceae bacterium]
MRLPTKLALRGTAAVGFTFLSSWASAQPGTSAPVPAPADWGRGGVCYEIFVRSFYDSDGDGVGDIPGLTQKLDYINDGNPSTRKDLGANCIWLMPVAQSPSYHGYDVTNYYQVNREYGTNEDFKRFIAEAHRRGIRVLVDLVLNHSSSEHPYFKSALLDRASPYRDWYRWSPRQRRGIGWEAPVWHRAGDSNEYYYGLFWGGMPDLNLANPAVKAEAVRIARFWLDEMHVDGFRLDAVGHFFEAGDSVRHASANHPWLRDYSAAIKRIAPNSFTIGEVTYDTPAEILRYYPDQLDSYFIFDVADALIDAVRSGSRTRLISSVDRVQRELPRGRWSPFLRNHDQTRTMTELKGDPARARLAATLLLTLPGFPFVYYGEELGMVGAKPDPRLRTPMPWTPGRAGGFTTGTAWEPLQPDSATANVQVQDNDPNSLLNHYRRLIHLRSGNSALGYGDFVPLTTTDEAVAAYARRKDGHLVVVIANLGTTRISGATVSTTENFLPAGRYTARHLIGGTGGTSVTIGAGGRVNGWVPVPALEPLRGYILELSR